MTKRRGAFTLLEVLVGVLILSVLTVSLYHLLRTSVKSVERTEEHVIAYCLLEKIAEDLRYRLSTPHLAEEAIKLEVNNDPVTSYVKADEDFNGDGTLDDWKDLARTLVGPKADADHVDRMLKRFFVTIKNYPPAADMADLAPDPGLPAAGVKKQVFVAWKTKDQRHERFVNMDIVQPVFSNYAALTKSGYGDNPLFVGPGSAAFNRAYRTSLKLAQAIQAANDALKPADDLVFRSNDYWPIDENSMLITGHTRINVKLVLLEKVLGMSRQELISLDTKYGGAVRDLDQEERHLTRQLIETALDGGERGQGRPSARFIMALDEMKLKCVSCHSQYFFKTDPELRGQAHLFLPKECVEGATEDGAFAGHVPLSEAKQWAKTFLANDRYVDPRTGEIAGDPGPVIEPPGKPK